MLLLFHRRFLAALTAAVVTFAFCYGLAGADSTDDPNAKTNGAFGSV